MAKLDDAYRCRFTFADGCQCREPICADDMGLCYYHQRKFEDRQNKIVAGNRISRFFNIDTLTATDLNSAFAALFAATAKGQIKPKTAATLAYLGQLMIQTQQLAKQEYLEAYEAEWFEIVQNSMTFNPEQTDPDSENEADSESGSEEAAAGSESPDLVSDSVESASDSSLDSHDTCSSDDEEPVSPEEALAAKVM